MDWGNALSGIDDELSGVLARNNALNNQKLAIIRTQSDIARQAEEQKRQDEEAKSLMNYRNDEIQARADATQQRGERQRAADAEQKSLLADVTTWSQMPEGPDKDKFGTTMAIKHKLSNMPGAGKGVFSITTDANGNQALVKVGDVGKNDVVKTTPAGQTALPEMTPVAKEQLFGAIRSGDYSKLTQMFPGRYNAAARIKLVNEAYGSDPNAGYDNPAVAKAKSDAYKNAYRTVENASSLLSGYENGWLKNVDYFVDMAKKLPDTGELGAAYTNLTLRELADKGLGSEVIAAARTRAMPVGREYTRMVGGSPTLQGVVHQTANEQAGKLIDIDSMTIPQILASVESMKQEVANTHDGLDQQKRDLEIDMKNLGLDKAHQLPHGTEEPKPDPKVTKAVEGSAGTWDQAQLKAVADKFFGGDITRAATYAANKNIKVTP